MKKIFLSLLFVGLFSHLQAKNEEANKLLAEIEALSKRIDKDLATVAKEPKEEQAKIKYVKTPDEELSKDSYLNYRVYAQVVDNIVIDTTLHLMWEDNNHSKMITKGYWKASSYCSELKLGGFEDWAVPTRRELLSITNGWKYNPAISSSMFKYIANDKYWTDRRVAKREKDAPYQFWVIDFSEGTTAFSLIEDKHYIRCVRHTLKKEKY